MEKTQEGEPESRKEHHARCLQIATKVEEKTGNIIMAGRRKESSFVQQCPCERGEKMEKYTLQSILWEKQCMNKMKLARATNNGRSIISIGNNPHSTCSNNELFVRQAAMTATVTKKVMRMTLMLDSKRQFVLQISSGGSSSTSSTKQ